MIEVFMPKAGMDMQEGRLIRWLKEVGDPVLKDEPIMEIETDKITMEAEAPGSGTLLAKLAEEGATVPVLAVIGYIGETGEAIPQARAAEASPPAAETPKESDTMPPGAATPYAKELAKEHAVDLLTVVPTGKRGEVLAEDVAAVVSATPLARAIAAAEGIDLQTIAGTGCGGKIRKADIPFAENQPSQEEPPCGRTVAVRRPLQGIRRVVGERMFASYSQVPTVMQSMKADFTSLLDFRAKLNEGRAQKFSINDFILKAAAIAVKEQPLTRTMLVGEELVTYHEANIGFAVSVDGGLFVPVLHNADRMTLSEISARARELAQKARDGSIRPAEYAGGTFSVSNMGMYDVYTFNPIINQPESGILGITGIQEELALVDGAVTVRKTAILCMSYDHRVMDGIGAALFKKRVKELLENPMEMLL